MAFVRFLKQSTAATLLLGPFLDETDGKTAETALTLSQSDILLWKEGGTTLAQKNEATSCTHRSNGLYTCPVDTTDTNTLGILSLSCHESGALPIRHDYIVVASNVHNSLITNTGYLNVNFETIGGSSAPVTSFAAALLGYVTGTSDNTGFTATTSIMDTTITEATADHYNGRVIVFTSGALAGQATLITDYALTGGRGRFTMSTLTEAVPNGTTFVIA
jgi:hypothetical protein